MFPLAFDFKILFFTMVICLEQYLRVFHHHRDGMWSEQPGRDVSGPWPSCSAWEGWSCGCNWGLVIGGWWWLGYRRRGWIVPCSTWGKWPWCLNNSRSIAKLRTIIPAFVMNYSMCYSRCLLFSTATTSHDLASCCGVAWRSFHDPPMKHQRQVVMVRPDLS